MEDRCRKCDHMFLEGSFHNCKAQARKDINELQRLINNIKAEIDNRIDRKLDKFGEYCTRELEQKKNIDEKLKMLDFKISTSWDSLSKELTDITGSMSFELSSQAMAIKSLQE